MIELPASQALRQSLQKEFGDEEGANKLFLRTKREKCIEACFTVEGVPLFGNLIKRIGFEVQQLLVRCVEPRALRFKLKSFHRHSSECMTTIRKRTNKKSKWTRP